MAIATMVHHFAHGHKVDKNSSPHPQQLKNKWGGLIIRLTDRERER